MTRSFVSTFLGFAVLALTSGCFHDSDKSSSNEATATQTEVALGHEAIAELRTWSTQLQDLERSGNGFDVEATIADSTAQAARSTGESLGLALYAISNASDSGLSSPFALADYLPGFTGTATGTILQTGNLLSITNGNINGDAVNVSVRIVPATAPDFRFDIVTANVSNVHAFSRIDSGRVSLLTTNMRSNVTRTFLKSELQATVGEKDSGLNNQFTGQFVFDMLYIVNNTTGSDTVAIARTLLGGEFSNVNQSFSASIEYVLRNSDKIDGSANISFDEDGRLSFDASVKGLPAAKVEVTLDTVSKSNVVAVVLIEANNVQIRLEYGSVITPKLTVTVKNMDMTTVVVIEPTADTDLDDGRFTGNVKVNGKLVGTIAYDAQLRALVVTFTDGTFETVLS